MANHSNVKDTGAFFTIVPETREVKVPSTHKVIGVVGDHLAEQLTFEIPKYIDGHDIAGCARRYVEWENVKDEIGSDQLVELTEPPEGAKDGMLYFTWTIRDRLAAAKGLVQFSIHFEDVDTNGLRLYHWGTTACKNCEILDSINAALGVYAAIWVAGDTLVIEDYTPVEDGALALEMPGIVPEGTLEIHEAGLHEVGKYAQVEVKTVYETPTVTEIGGGAIKAEANGMATEYQTDLTPDKLLKGETVLGVEGTAGVSSARVYIDLAGGTNRGSATVFYNTAEAVTLSTVQDIVGYEDGFRKTVTVCLGGIIVLQNIMCKWTIDETKSYGVEVLERSTLVGSPLVVKVTGNGALVVSYEN